MAAAFSSIPNELILQIWSHVLEPKDVERFALVSKKILALAPLQEHHRLKDQFSTLHFEDENDRRGSPPANFLADILINPRPALYVNKIWIKYWKIQWDHLPNVSSNMVTDHHLPYSQNSMQLFEEAVKTSAFIPEPEIAEWISELHQGDERNILALIISLLPNLKSFEVLAGAGGEYRLAYMIRQISISRTTAALL